MQTYLSRCCSLRDALEAGSIDHLELAGELDRLAAGIASELRARVTQGEEDIVFNATSLGKQVFLEDYPRCVDPHSSTRIAACSDDGLHSQCVVDVPPFGFVKGVSRPPSAPSDPHRQRDTSEVRIRNASWLGRVFGSRPAVVLEDGSMANDFMEVQIDPSKGYLRSMYVLNQRGNRLSGQVSWVPQPLQPRQALNDDSFQVLLDPQMRVVHSSKVRGTIEVTGRLAGGVCAIRYTLWHGARWLEIEIQGDGADAGVGFPVWRMVWPSEAATIAAWSQGTKGKLPAPLQCAVELIEIDDVDHRIHYATGGLSMHRRYGHRALASIVPVDSEGQYHAKLAVGLNWPNPWETAIDRMVPNLVSVSTASGASMGKSPDTGAWLARCNMSNLRFRWIDPRTILKVSSISEVEIEDAIAPDACLWVVETAGKAGTARVGCVRPIQRAWRVDFRGCEYDRLKVEQGEVLLPFEGWERSRVALCFES